MNNTSSRIVWNRRASINGTSRLAYLDTPWTFNETVGRLITLAGRPDTTWDKSTVHFTGLYDGSVFTVYDYKGGGLRIGGHPGLDVADLLTELVERMREAVPAPYVGHMWIDPTEDYSD